MTNRRDTLAILGCGLAATAIAIKRVSPPLSAAVDYTIGYAPWWIGVTGAVLGGATVLGIGWATAGRAPSATPAPAPAPARCGDTAAEQAPGRTTVAAVAAKPSARGNVATVTAKPSARGEAVAGKAMPSARDVVAGTTTPSARGDVVAATPRARRGLLAVGWLAVTLLLWSAAGVVLDGFRSFFAITGIPAGDFAIVDWPGFAARFLGLTACGAVLAVVLRYQRGSHCGCAQSRSGTRVPGLVTIGMVWPYPLIKTYWWLGGPVARPTGFDEGLPAGELLAAAAATVLSLAMLLCWWRSGLMRSLTLTAGRLAAAVLLSMGALSFFGTASQLLGLTDGPVDFGSGIGVVLVSVVYGSWLALGIGFTVLTWRYQQATRPTCRDCAGLAAPRLRH